LFSTVWAILAGFPFPSSVGGGSKGRGYNSLARFYIFYFCHILRSILFLPIPLWTPPPPPQTTAIYGDFKKSTAISKGYNVGLRYINIHNVSGNK
jgi:hypothetical protein